MVNKFAGKVAVIVIVMLVVTICSIVRLTSVIDVSDFYL